MTSQNFIELAKQGDAKAIAFLLSQQLQPKGINVKVNLKDTCLYIFLESSQVIKRELLVTWLSNIFLNLDAKPINSLKIYSKETGNQSPEWSQFIELKKNNLTLTPSEIIHETSSEIVNSTTTFNKISRNKAITKKPENRKIIILLVSSTSIIFITSIFIGLSFWLKLTQTQALGKAQNLIASLEDNDNSLNLDVLQGNRNQLQKSVEVLDATPNLPIPGSIYSKITDEKQKINSRLESVDKNIKILEKLLPEIKEVVHKFTAINSRIDVGMNYLDYRTQVSDLKVAFDRFTEEPGAKNYPFYQKLLDAFNQYNFALDVWRSYIESNETNNFLPVSSSYGRILISEYQVPTSNIIGDDYIYLNSALPKVWQKASENVKEVQSQL